MIKLSLSFKGKLLKVYQPRTEQIRIGRNPDCEVAIDNIGFDDVHAIIEVNGETATLVDKSQTNGNNVNHIAVAVNGTRTKRCELNHQDQIDLGKYVLKFTREVGQDLPSTETAFPKKDAPLHGWLQIMNGPKLGRTIKLENPMVRLGKAGKACAMISNRDGKYYIAHLEGEPKTRVKNQEISEARVCLNDGDTVQVGETKMLFFMQ